MNHCIISNRDEGAGGGNGIAPRSDVPADTSDFEDSEPAGVSSSGDDIPF